MRLPQVRAAPFNWERGGVPRTSSIFSFVLLERELESENVRGTLDLIGEEVNASEVHAGRGKWTILVQGNVVEMVT